MPSMEPESVLQKLSADLASYALVAADEVRSDTNFNHFDEKTTAERYHSAIQSLLLKSNASAVVLKGKRPRDDSPSNRRRLRPWRPLRPALAQAAAQMIRDGTGLVEVPAKKKDCCILPFKIFSRNIALELAKTEVGSNLSSSSIKFAVGEVAAAVFGEAQGMIAQGKAGTVKLHCTTDAAWKGTTARGGGLAMDEEGKHLVFAAAARVVERLAEPLQISKRDWA